MTGKKLTDQKDGKIYRWHTGYVGIWHDMICYIYYVDADMQIENKCMNDWVMNKSISMFETVLTKYKWNKNDKIKKVD